MYEFKNPNPCNKLDGDCVIRAISISMDKSWDDIYIELSLQGFMMCDMPNANIVWQTYLLNHGYRMFNVLMPIRQFSRDYPNGNYILGTGSHVVCCIDGIYYDTWDSGDEFIEKVFAR